MPRSAICPLLCAVALSLSLGAQVLDSTSPGVDAPEVQHNKRLRILVDRTTVRAYEPIYLSVTAEHFVSPEARPEISVWQGDAQPQPLVIDERDWITGDTVSGSDTPVQRIGCVLQLRKPAPLPESPRDYLFPKAGDYNLRVKVGPDGATIKIKIIPTDDRERDAWDKLGDQLDPIIYNGLNDHPRQLTVDVCSRVMRTFPGTVCAGYCQAYMSISKFKVAFDRHGKSGGKDVYAPYAKELKEVHEAFGESFLGEQTGFYAAYAMGLTKDFEGLLALASAVKTHVTPFSDALAVMKNEVLSHVAPPGIAVNPATIPSTRPTTAKAQ